MCVGLDERRGKAKPGDNHFSASISVREVFALEGFEGDGGLGAYGFKANAGGNVDGYNFSCGRAVDLGDQLGDASCGRSSDAGAQKSIHYQCGVVAGRAIEYDFAADGANGLQVSLGIRCGWLACEDHLKARRSKAR
jgi:hypothetical protein